MSALPAMATVSRRGRALSRALTGVCVLVLAGASEPVAAEDARPPAQHGVHRDWTVVGDGDGGCLLTQSVYGKRTGALLVQAVLDDAGGNDGAVVLALRVPTGVRLADGIAYRHSAGDRVGVGLEWQSCDAERCTAMARLSAAEFARLRRGSEIIVGYRPLPESRFLNVPLSLMGLTAAWRQKQACMLG